MGELDQEDKNFLEDLIEELRKHDGTYDSEADELENIVFRLTRDEEGEDVRKKRNGIFNPEGIYGFVPQTEAKD